MTVIELLHDFIVMSIIVIMFLVSYRWYLTYQKTENFIKEDKLRHERVLKRREQEHERKIQRIKRGRIL